MDDLPGASATLRQVEGFEGILCPWCGADGSALVFEDGQAVESPSLPQAPWADAALLSSRCRACGRVASEVEISVVVSAPPASSCSTTITTRRRAIPCIWQAGDGARGSSFIVRMSAG